MKMSNMTRASRRERGQEGFLLSELMISTIIFSAITLGLLMGFTGLERCG